LYELENYQLLEIISYLSSMEINVKDILQNNMLPIIVGVSIALIGIVIQKTRAYFLIAGYNTAPAEDKMKVDIAKVAIALRNTFIALGLLWVIVPIGSDLINLGQIKWLIVIVLHIAITLRLVFFVNSNEKFKKQNYA